MAIASRGSFPSAILVWAVLVLLAVEKHTVLSICSEVFEMGASVTNDTAIRTLRGNLSLLIPAWRIDHKGHVKLWRASVEGNVSNTAIEFQIFRPVEGKPGVYSLVHGNRFDEDIDTQSSSNISVMVDRSISLPEIPVQSGYIIGVRLMSGGEVDPNFGLQYVSAGPGEGVDVYYWNMGGNGGQDCSLSTCDTSATVLRGVIPLVSWQFCSLESLTLTNVLFRTYIAQFPVRCTGASAPTCVVPTTTTALPVVSSATTLVTMTTLPIPSPWKITTSSLTRSLLPSLDSKQSATTPPVVTTTTPNHTPTHSPTLDNTTRPTQSTFTSTATILVLCTTVSLFLVVAGLVIAVIIVSYRFMKRRLSPVTNECICRPVLQGKIEAFQTSLKSKPTNPHFSTTI